MALHAFSHKELSKSDMLHLDMDINLLVSLLPGSSQELNLHRVS